MYHFGTLYVRNRSLPDLCNDSQLKANSASGLYYFIHGGFPSLLFTHDRKSIAKTPFGPSGTVHMLITERNCGVYRHNVQIVKNINGKYQNAIYFFFFFFLHKNVKFSYDKMAQMVKISGYKLM